MKEIEVKEKRCAVYVRKSVQEGLDMSFNSLDAQEEACRNFIASQKFNGWMALPETYADGGYSGGNVNRPGFQRLLRDCEDGKIDVIVCYKLDRLTRSIADFVALSECFDKWGVSFVSVTQNLDTSSSAGRMLVNILITFGQFEREQIAERIKDKMAASRRRGQWVGGCPPYGYKNVDKRLVIDEEAAETVRWIFGRYLEIQSPKTIAMELAQAGKSMRSGKPWNAAVILHMLKNVVYIGKINYLGKEIHDGEHMPIISEDIWNKVQEFLKHKGPSESHAKKVENISPLGGILRCGHCGCAMTPTHTVKKGRRYFYYACAKDKKRAISTCPVKQIRAGDIENVVFRELAKILQAPDIVAAIAKAADVEPKQVFDIFAENFWVDMNNAEKARIMQLLIETVVINENDISIELKTSGVKSMMEEARYAEEND